MARIYTSPSIPRAIAMSFAVSLTALSGLCVDAADDGTYVPETGRAGSEAQGRILAGASAKIYVPQSLAPGERLRGWYQYLLNRPADSAIFRDFAERAKFVIGPTKGNGHGIGHPEAKHLPVTIYGHSGGGRKAWDLACQPDQIDRVLAIIAHHSVISWEVAEPPKDNPHHIKPIPSKISLLPGVQAGDPRGEIPVWNVMADREKHQACNATSLMAAAEVSKLGWKWTFVLGNGECHQSNDAESLKLQMLWLEEVAKLRIRGEIPADGSIPLTEIDETKSWVGYIELHPPVWGDYGFVPWRVADVAVYPYDGAPGKGAVEFTDGRYGGYVWLPTEAFAKAWLTYHRTATVIGDASPQIQVQRWTGLDDTANPGLGWKLFQAKWCHSYLSVRNLPNFQGDQQNVHWEVLNDLPEGVEIHANGRVMTNDDLQPCVHKVRLRATYGNQSWEDDLYVALRSSTRDDALKLKVNPPSRPVPHNAACPIQWESTMPLGLLQWHSSIDGDLKPDYGDLSSTGQKQLAELSKGTHLITVLVYSAEPTVQRQAESFLMTVK